MNGLLFLEVDRRCFVCGPENPTGLQAAFEAGEGSARGTFTPRHEHQGYSGVSHGGILAALLDEAMVYAAASLGAWVATAEMTIRYCRPAPTAAPIAVQARVVRQRRRLFECEAELRAEDGTLLASASGKLIRSESESPVRLASPARDASTQGGEME